MRDGEWASEDGALVLLLLFTRVPGQDTSHFHVSICAALGLEDAFLALLRSLEQGSGASTLNSHFLLL